MARKKVSTETAVGEYIEFWQEELRIRDWRISFEIITDPEFDAYAKVRSVPTIGASHIKLLEPSLVPEDWEGCKDLEVTVVHELLHIRFYHCIPEPEKGLDVHEELAIETVAIALVANRRGLRVGDLF